MPYADPEKRRASDLAKGRKYRAKMREQKYGPDAPDQRGKHRNHAKGGAHPRWNHGRLLTSHGYVAVRVSPDHPHRWGGGYAYQHIIVAEAATGRPLESNEVVHHKDHDKTNNAPENLEIFLVSAHAKEHSGERGRDALGRFPPRSLRGCRAFPVSP